MLIWSSLSLWLWMSTSILLQNSSKQPRFHYPWKHLTKPEKDASKHKFAMHIITGHCTTNMHPSMANITTRETEWLIQLIKAYPLPIITAVAEYGERDKHENSCLAERVSSCFYATIQWVLIKPQRRSLKKVQSGVQTKDLTGCMAGGCYQNVAVIIVGYLPLSPSM